MEPLAIKKYEEVTSCHVIPAGLMVKSCQPWACASPDGLVEKDGKMIVLEVKCPSSCRGKNISVPYLKNNKNLMQSHQYYSQVQWQMYCSNVESCDFFVFSENDYILTQVERNDNFL